MFPPRLRRFLDDLVDAADVVLAYEAPPQEAVREVSAPGGRTVPTQPGRAGPAARPQDRHTLRRTRRDRQPRRRPGVAAPVDVACVAEH